MSTPKQASALIGVLGKQFSARAMIDVGSPEDTLIMTMLSARARDEQVLVVYGPLRKRFPTLQALAKADIRALERALDTMGLFRAKARLLKALARALLERHGGQVPRTMEELVELPGVGRKTASCVLWYAFGIPAIAVDTHVFRIAKRLGWAKGRTPEVVEQELRAFLPRDAWGEVNRVFVPFGRAICKSGVPRCEQCPAAAICPSARLAKRGTLAS